MSSTSKIERAAYMREYNSRPGNREKKRARDANRYQTDAVHRGRVIERSKERYWANQEEKRRYIADRLRDYKIKAVTVKGGRCESCGWNGHPAALQFHHRDPSQKKFTITTSVMGSPRKYPWDVIVAEIEKCDLLCANCHFMTESAWDLEGVWPVG